MLVSIGVVICLLFRFISCCLYCSLGKAPHLLNGWTLACFFLGSLCSVPWPVLHVLALLKQFELVLSVCQPCFSYFIPRPIFSRSYTWSPRVSLVFAALMAFFANLSTAELPIWSLWQPCWMSFGDVAHGHLGPLVLSCHSLPWAPSSPVVLFPWFSSLLFLYFENVSLCYQGAIVSKLWELLRDPPQKSCIECNKMPFSSGPHELPVLTLFLSCNVIKFLIEQP